MFAQKLKALLATSRIANVPSVVCNVFTGMMLVIFISDYSSFNSSAITVMLAGVCLYIAGNFLNDWYDVTWDRQHRPERAIPIGLFPRWLYLATASTLCLSGFALCLNVSLSTMAVYLAITVCVVLYTVLHKRYSYSIWIMGACRAGLYLLGVVATKSFSSFESIGSNWQIVAFFACVIAVPMLGLLSYIAGISLLARYETRSRDLSHQSNSFAAMLLLLPALTHSCIIFHFLGSEGSYGKMGFCFIAMIPFVTWTYLTVFRKFSVSAKVGRLLAGIPLVDSIYLFCLFISIYSADHGLAGSLVVPLVSLTCFLLALLLQKIAPAT